MLSCKHIAHANQMKNVRQLLSSRVASWVPVNVRFVFSIPVAVYAANEEIFKFHSIYAWRWCCLTFDLNCVKFIILIVRRHTAEMQTTFKKKSQITFPSQFEEKIVSLLTRLNFSFRRNKCLRPPDINIRFCSFHIGDEYVFFETCIFHSTVSCLDADHTTLHCVNSSNKQHGIFH